MTRAEQQSTREAARNAREALRRKAIALDVGRITYQLPDGDENLRRLSDQGIAEQIGVSRRTIARWKRSEEFREAARVAGEKVSVWWSEQSPFKRRKTISSGKSRRKTKPSVRPKVAQNVTALYTKEESNLTKSYTEEAPTTKATAPYPNTVLCPLCGSVVASRTGTGSWQGSVNGRSVTALKREWLPNPLYCSACRAPVGHR